MSWPPTVDDLKLDLDLVDADDRDTLVLSQQLAAAVAFVERTHRGRYYFDPVTAVFQDLPLPGPEMELGTVRLAGRWYSRRRSPDGIVALGDLGSSNIPGFDSDLERMLEMGRYGGSMIV
jgi:hypothetical protein